jgi:hypothetical protein
VEIIKQELENQKPATLRNPWWDFSALGYGRISTVERCLAGEADGEQGDIVEHALPLSTPMSKALPIHAKA